MSEFDFESIKNKAIEQLKAGKPLLGKDGAFAPLLERILNAALDIVNEILEEITTNSLDVFEEKIEPFEDKLSADEIGFTVNESLFDDVETTET